MMALPPSDSPALVQEADPAHSYDPFIRNLWAASKFKNSTQIRLLIKSAPDEQSRTIARAFAIRMGHSREMTAFLHEFSKGTKFLKLLMTNESWSREAPVWGVVADALHRGMLGGRSLAFIHFLNMYEHADGFYAEGLSNDLSSLFLNCPDHVITNWGTFRAHLNRLQGFHEGIVNRSKLRKLQSLYSARLKHEPQMLKEILTLLEPVPEE